MFRMRSIRQEVRESQVRDIVQRRTQFALGSECELHSLITYNTAFPIYLIMIMALARVLEDILTMCSSNTFQQSCLNLDLDCILLGNPLLTEQIQ